MSNDTNYSLIIRHAKRKYLEHVVQYLERKKARWNVAQEQGKSCDDIMAELGLSCPSEVVSWGFQFGSIERDPDSKGFMVTAESYANESMWNLTISGEEGELHDLLDKFPELDIEGTYSDDYGAGSVCGYEKIWERSEEEESARTAEWGEDGDAEYNEATKEMLLKAYTGQLSIIEARQLIQQGADVNGVINCNAFASLLVFGGGKLLEAIPEFIDKGLKTESLTRLTEKAARKIGEMDGRVDLSSLRNLDLKTATVLINTLNAKKCPPYLSIEMHSYVTGIMDIISGYKGPLELIHIRNISVDEAKSLARHKGGYLCFDGLTKLSKGVAGALAKYHGTLDFNGLTELTKDAAIALAMNEGDIYLDGLAKISKDVAASLAKHKRQLFLSGLAELDADVAEVLAGHKGGLILDGLTEMSDTTVELLAKSEGGLDLNGLTELSINAARALGKHNGGIFLEGLTTISDSAAEELGNIAGDELSLTGLTRISVKAAEALARHKGEICLGSPVLSKRAAQILQRHGSIYSDLDLDAIAKGTA